MSDNQVHQLGQNKGLVGLYEVINDQSQESIDRLLEHCAQAFNCGVASVCVVDKEHQKLLSIAGTNPRGNSMDTSFCRAAVSLERTILIDDAADDPRFSNHPMVVGTPHFRSHIGVPFRHATGEFIGALCLFDARPAHFLADQVAQVEWYAMGLENILKVHIMQLESNTLNARVQAQNTKLKDINRLFQRAEKIAKIGSWELEVETGDVFWSDEVYAIHSLSPDVAHDVSSAINYYNKSDQPWIMEKINRAITDGIPFEYDADLIAEDGQVKRIRAMGERIEGDANSPTRLVGIAQDITNAYQSELALRHAAEHDYLTGLLNRSAYDQILQDRLRHANKQSAPVAVVLIDLDGFKDLNDTFGHVVGDVVLEGIASRITKAAPPESVVARWGGDEFAIILPPHVTACEAETMGAALIKNICHQSQISGRCFEMSATAGLALAEDGISAKELVRRADSALYHGKRHEPGTIQVHNPAHDRSDIARQDAIHQVQAALREDRIFAGYQPIIDLRSGEKVGFEALMRLNTRTGLQLTATEVLPALIDPIVSRKVSERMTELVSAEIPQLLGAMPAMEFVSINATEGDLLTRDFAERFLQKLAMHKVNPAHVTLEVTETMLLVEKTEPVQAVLHKLHARGVRIALDDFGTGYSSLTHLRDFPIDKVKIDISFVQSLSDQQQARTIVQAMIGMAKNMEIDVVAEGIETQDQLQILRQMGCQYGQGYLFGMAEDVGRQTLKIHHNTMASKKHASAA